MDDEADATSQFLKNFADPEAVANYADGVSRFVPGLEGLHRMAGLLLAENAPENARILVLGAGGGIELKALADAYPQWTFVGVDPAPEMLKLAAQTLGPRIERVELVEGYIEDAPEGPFDGATCLLTLHFLPSAQRVETIRQIHRRLRQGASFIAAHGSFPQSPSERSIWLDRYAAYAISSGADPEQARTARDAIEASEMMLSPEMDEALLRDGGFSDVQLFYSAFTWRGWVGTHNRS